MWCCVGTGMENHGKYGQFIYTHDTADNALYVNLFIPSELNWKEKKIKIVQETNFPNEEGTTLTVNPSKATQFKLLIRYPSWVEQGKCRWSATGLIMQKVRSQALI